MSVGNELEMLMERDQANSMIKNPNMQQTLNNYGELGGGGMPQGQGGAD